MRLLTDTNSLVTTSGFLKVIDKVITFIISTVENIPDGKLSAMEIGVVLALFWLFSNFKTVQNMPNVTSRFFRPIQQAIYCNIGMRWDTYICLWDTLQFVLLE